ncbi:homeodomain transcription factor ste12 [Allomyces arbusculus]|nr:homeodomain transcription factor ste12 [Allomyces arbusculus]
MGDAHAPPPPPPPPTQDSGHDHAALGPPPPAELAANWMVPAPAVPSPLLVHGHAQHQQQQQRHHLQEQQQQHQQQQQQYGQQHPHQHAAPVNGLLPPPSNGHFPAQPAPTYGSPTVTHESLPHAHASTSAPLPPPVSTASMLPLPLPPGTLPPPQADASTVVATAPPPAPGTSTPTGGGGGSGGGSGGALATLLQPNPVAQLPLSDQLAHLHLFLATAPSQWDPAQRIRRFLLPNGEHVSCVWHNNLFFVTGTDVIRALLFRFQAMNRPVRNLKKFEEGIFSDLRNLKPGVDAALEESRSEFLEWLHKHNCVRTQKKQKVFYWFSVPWDQLFYDALERDIKREAQGLEPTSYPVGVPPPDLPSVDKNPLFLQHLEAEGVARGGEGSAEGSASGTTAASTPTSTPTVARRARASNATETTTTTARKRRATGTGTAVRARKRTTAAAQAAAAAAAAAQEATTEEQQPPPPPPVSAPAAPPQNQSPFQAPPLTLLQQQQQVGDQPPSQSQAGVQQQMGTPFAHVPGPDAQQQQQQQQQQPFSNGPFGNPPMPQNVSQPSFATAPFSNSQQQQPMQAQQQPQPQPQPQWYQIQQQQPPSQPFQQPQTAPQSFQQLHAPAPSHQGVPQFHAFPPSNAMQSPPPFPPLQPTGMAGPVQQQQQQAGHIVQPPLPPPTALDQYHQHHGGGAVQYQSVPAPQQPTSHHGPLLTQGLSFQPAGAGAGAAGPFATGAANGAFPAATTHAVHAQQQQYMYQPVSAPQQQQQQQQFMSPHYQPSPLLATSTPHLPPLRTDSSLSSASIAHLQSPVAPSPAAPPPSRLLLAGLIDPVSAQSTPLAGPVELGYTSMPTPHHHRQLSMPQQQSYPQPQQQPMVVQMGPGGPMATPTQQPMQITLPQPPPPQMQPMHSQQQQQHVQVYGHSPMGAGQPPGNVIVVYPGQPMPYQPQQQHAPSATPATVLREPSVFQSPPTMVTTLAAPSNGPFDHVYVAPPPPLPGTTSAPSQYHNPTALMQAMTPHTAPVTLADAVAASMTPHTAPVVLDPATATPINGATSFQNLVMASTAAVAAPMTPASQGLLPTDPARALPGSAPLPAPAATSAGSHVYAATPPPDLFMAQPWVADALDGMEFAWDDTLIDYHPLPTLPLASPSKRAGSAAPQGALASALAANDALGVQQSGIVKRRRPSMLLNKTLSRRLSMTKDVLALGGGGLGAALGAPGGLMAALAPMGGRGPAGSGPVGSEPM